MSTFCAKAVWYHRHMLPVVTAEQMREIDHLTTERSGVSSQALMDAASASSFKAVRKHFDRRLAGRQALVLCGKGNNGGDGAGLARLLGQQGVECTLVLFGSVEDTRGDARTNFEAARLLVGQAVFTFVECNDTATWQQLAGAGVKYDLIVDALFGTGLTRPLDGIYQEVVEYLRLVRETSEPFILSVDIPSGLNADLTEPIGPTVQADLTVTFTAPKAANVLPPACDFGGELTVADIGSPRQLVEETARTSLFLTEPEDVKRWLVATRYVPGSYKNTHGHVLIAAGSRGYSGAAVLCGDAAIRSGAGLVTVATPASAQSSVASAAMPEVITTALAETDRGAVSDDAVDHFLKLAQKATVVAIGPGLTSDDERTRRFVRSIIERRSTPCVIDADGLNCLAPWPRELGAASRYPLVLTPHPGEMRRLLGGAGEIKDSVATARQFATENQLILLLKGSRSIVAAPDGRVFVNPTGNPGLGTAGSGDTLTGLTAGFLAQAFGTLKDEANALEAVIAALYVGGLAGDFAASRIGMRAMVASDIRDHFSYAIRFLDSPGEYSGP